MLHRDLVCKHLWDRGARRLLGVPGVTECPLSDVATLNDVRVVWCPAWMAGELRLQFWNVASSWDGLYRLPYKCRSIQRQLLPH